jgi:Zn2+/Cd2+-exporting ATPase
MTAYSVAHQNHKNMQPSPPSSPQSWLTQDWLEPRLVAVTALAIAASYVGGLFGIPAWLDTVLAVTAYVAGGFYGVQTALHSLFDEHQLDVDLLMVLAALGAALIGAWHEGAMLLFLFSLSNVLQDYAIGRSRNAIKSLFKLYPEEARVKRGAGTEVIPFDQIQVDDIILIEPGERLPVDGEIINGTSAVDESPITGESIPVDKTIGDQVFAGTLNKQGALDVRATKTAANNMLARIIQLVEDAQENQAPTERFLDRFEQVYATGIVGAILLFIAIPPLFFGVDFQSNFYQAMVLMTVASPCALVISVPAAFISAIASAARSGVLFKGGAYLEKLAGIEAVAFDKTGTLTHGKPHVVDVISCCELGENDLLRVAASIEDRSEHPLAKAIVKEAQRRSLTIESVEDFAAISGQGVVGTVGGATVRAGSLAYLRQHFAAIPPQLEADYERLESNGKTVIGVVRSGHCDGCGECDFGTSYNSDWVGLIALADKLRPEAAGVVQALKANGIEVAMFTGDNARVAQAIAAEVGIERVHAGLLPEQKVTELKALQAEIGATVMVGDGVNDAPALATAEVGIAMGAAGTDVALETADVVLMGDKLELISEAIALSQKAQRVVWQNIVFSLAVIVLLVFGALFINLPLPLGVLGHEGSTVIVVLNGLITLLILPELARRRKSSHTGEAATVSA